MGGKPEHFAVAVVRVVGLNALIAPPGLPRHRLPARRHLVLIRVSSEADSEQWVVAVFGGPGAGSGAHRGIVGQSVDIVIGALGVVGRVQKHSGQAVLRGDAWSDNAVPRTADDPHPAQSAGQVAHPLIKSGILLPHVRIAQVGKLPADAHACIAQVGKFPADAHACIAVRSTVHQHSVAHNPRAGAAAPTAANPVAGAPEVIAGEFGVVIIRIGHQAGRQGVAGVDEGDVLGVEVNLNDGGVGVVRHGIGVEAESAPHV